ncbi:MAG: rod shape-determining protein MreC [Flavobacteriales bacterium]|nr:rod shape-determining protein MreC [Flavobacteriales bacterium]
MRALFSFIWRNHYFFVFVAFEILCFSLVVRNNTYQRAGFINSSSRVAGGVFGAWDNVTSYFSLREKNRLLADENARLRSLLMASSSTSEYQRTMDSLNGMQYFFYPAEVIANSLNQRSNYITLSSGSEDGLEEYMGLISGKGIVGMITNVSKHYAVARSLLHKEFTVGARFSRNKYTGVIQWDGNDPSLLTMGDVPLPADILEGDTVVTSGASAVFPAGLMIGTVVDYEVLPGDNFYSVKVRTAADFGNLSFVYAIQNIRKDEQQELQKMNEEPMNE